tara:strand:- start:2383 stop:2622 length:240 start_codon:yes stop_codon:yes gene_type:complete
MSRRYNSFAEIDAQLKILGLQKKIDKERLKLNLNRAKSELSPSHIFGGFKGTVQEMALTFMIKKLSDVFRKRDREVLSD